MNRKGRKRRGLVPGKMAVMMKLELPARFLLWGYAGTCPLGCHCHHCVVVRVPERRLCGGGSRDVTFNSICLFFGFTFVWYNSSVRYTMPFIAGQLIASLLTNAFDNSHGDRPILPLPRPFLACSSSKKACQPTPCPLSSANPRFLHRPSRLLLCRRGPLAYKRWC